MSIETDRQAEAFELLASKFPKRYQVKATKFLRGLLKALAVGDGFIQTEVEAVRDNLIAVTSSGQYLDRNAGRYGIVRGQGTGILDPDFRDLIPILGMSPKQISHILLQIIDTIYGPYASHANATAANPEPYDLTAGFSLRVRVDDGIQEIFFDAQDAISLAAATAQELATAISKKTGGRLIGSVLLDARSGSRFLNIRTSTIGSQGFVQVLGGNAQTKLHFPETRPTTPSIATWTVSRYLGTDEMIYTVTGGVGPDLKAAGVITGDFCTVRTDSGFNLNNTGNFKVTFVGSGFFRVENGNGTPEVGVTQDHVDDFTFYAPDLNNILLTNRPAAVLETSARELTVFLPVTSPIVKRTIRGGAHFHQGLTSVLSTTSNSVTIGATTGFETPGVFKPTLSRLLSQGIVSSVSGTNVILLNAQNWPVQGSFYAASERQFFYYEGISGNTLQNVTPSPPGSLAGADVSYTERYLYTGISGQTLTGVFPDPTNLVNQEIAAAGAITGTNFPGSFMFDPQAQFIAASEGTTIAETVREGSVKTIISVTDVSNWNDSGYFVVEFGTDKEEGPIKFLAKVGNTALIVDPGHVYSTDHLDGVGIRQLAQIGPYTPRTDGTDLAVYTTSTSPARDLLAQYLRLIAACGVSLRFIIQAPEEKWAVLPELFSTDPLATSLV